MNIIEGLKQYETLKGTINTLEGQIKRITVLKDSTIKEVRSSKEYKEAITTVLETLLSKMENRSYEELGQNFEILSLKKECNINEILFDDILKGLVNMDFLDNDGYWVEALPKLIEYKRLYDFLDKFNTEFIFSDCTGSHLSTKRTMIEEFFPIIQDCTDFYIKDNKIFIDYKYKEEIYIFKNKGNIALRKTDRIFELEESIKYLEYKEMLVVQELKELIGRIY